MPDDGIIDAGSLTALFAWMGAAPAIAAETSLSANVHSCTYGIIDTGLRLAHPWAALNAYEIAIEARGDRLAAQIGRLCRFFDTMGMRGLDCPPAP